MERRLKARNNETGDIVEFKWFDKADPTETDMAEIFKERGAEYGTITAEPPPLLESLGRGAIKGLPLAGMAAGGTLGGPLGAGILSAAGKNIQRIIERQAGLEEPKPLAEEYVDIGLTGLTGALAEMGGRGVGEAAKAGYGKLVKPAGRELMALYRRGFPVTKGTMIEGLAKRIPPGSLFFKQRGRQLNKMVLEAAEQAKQEMKLAPKGAEYPATGETDRAIEKWISESGGENVTIVAEGIDDWFKKFGPRMGEIRGASEQLGIVLDKIRHAKNKTGTVALKDVNKALIHVWDTYGKKKYRNIQYMFGQLKENIMKDLIYAERTTGAPFHSGRMAVEELYQLTPAINRSRWIEGIFSRSTQYIDETGEYVFQPVKFKQAVENNYSVMVKKFGKKSEVPELMRKFADEMMVTSRDLAHYTSTAKTPWYKQMGTGGIVGAGIYGPAYAAGGAPGIVVPAGFDTAMAYSLANPKGYLKRFLFRETPGALLGKIGKEATRLGIMFPREKEPEVIRGPQRRQIK
jgi:hypothetical protein